MGAPPADAPFDPYVHALIRRKATQLGHHPALRGTDTGDLAGELTLHLLRQLRRHDSRRGSFHTFADRVVRNHASNLIEAAGRAKRDRKRVGAGVDPDALISRDVRDHV